jgi:hypothetical protein
MAASVAALGRSGRAVSAIAPADPARRRDFVVDVSAKMLRRNDQLSKNARHLYVTLRALADGKTGELKINGRWLRAKAFDAAAEICRDLRLAAMRELIDAGLVTRDFEMAVRFIGGRRRAVRSRSQYTVYRTAQKPNDSGGADPQIVEKPCILLKSISSTVEEIDSQVFPEAPTGGGSGFSDLPFQGKREGEETSSSSTPPSAKRDDDPVPPPDGEDLEANIQRHIQEAKTLLLRKGWDPHLASAALQFIEERSDHSGTIPSSAKYFIVAIAAAMADPRDKAKILERAERRRRVMPSDSELLRNAEELARESETSRRPMKEILESRAVISARAS